MGHQVDLPNTDWVAGNHWCVPLYYGPRSSPTRSRRSPDEGARDGRSRLHRLARRRQADRAGHEPRIFDLVASPYHDAGSVETSSVT